MHIGFGSVEVHLKKILFLVFLITILMMGCANQPRDMKLLSFMNDGTTTRSETLLQLGQPTARFESDRILTYRIGGDAQAGYFISKNTSTWIDTNYSLVLVFDTNGILESHSLVHVQ